MKKLNNLYEKYPKIFPYKDKSKIKEYSWFGFETGDGWYWLIDNLCGTIQRYLDANKHLKVPQVVATQVKEKFSSLRFYINGGDETIRGMIWLAESMSSGICEECGSLEGKPSGDRWRKTLCNKCRKRRRK